MDKKQISHRIRMLRERLNYSQEAFAAPAGLNFHQISKFERAEVLPTTEAIIRLCDAHNLNSHWLLTGVGKMFIERDIDVPRHLSVIKSADELESIASYIEDAYNKYQLKRTATAPWILNLVNSMSLLLETRNNVPRKRKLWRGSEVVDTVMHDLKTTFPGDERIDLKDRIKEATGKLSNMERIRADYAWNIAKCFRTIVSEFAFLEHAGKYTLPNDVFSEITVQLIPWCNWVAKAAISRSLPLEVNPLLLNVHEENNDENLKEIRFNEQKELVSMEAFTEEKRSVFWCGFKFMQGKLIVPCGGVSLYALVKASDMLVANPKEKLAEIGVWSLFRDNDVPAFSVQKDGIRFFLSNAEFEQFMELVKLLWERSDVKAAVVKNVLNECGAL